MMIIYVATKPSTLHIVSLFFITVFLGHKETTSYNLQCVTVKDIFLFISSQHTVMDFFFHVQTIKLHGKLIEKQNNIAVSNVCLSLKNDAEETVFFMKITIVVIPYKNRA